MTTQVSTKVRLVRCPKCRQVLAELPEVPLYKCGGCGTVLQAKNRRLETCSTGLSSQETDSIAKSRQDDVLEASSPNKDFTSRPEVESLSDKDNIRCQDENGDSVELREDASVLSSSPTVAFPRNEDSSIEANDFLNPDSLGQISERYNIKFRDDNGESSRGREFSDELPSSGEFTLEAEVYNTPESSGHVGQHKKYQTKGEESQRVWRKGDDFVAKVHNLPGHEFPEGVLSPEGKKDNHASPENDDKSRICFADQNRDFHGEIKPSGLDSSLGIISRENENISPSAEQSTEKNTNASVCDSNVTSRSPSKESLVLFYLTSPDNEHPDHFPREAIRNFGRLGSLDTLGSSVPPMTNYPKTESYYAYDGSESSYDGTDDQICERISQPSRNNKDDDIRTTEMLRKNGIRANNTANSEPEWGPTSSSHRATMRNNHWSQSPETNRYAGGNRMRLDEQEGVSRVPFPSRAGPGPTSYRHGSLPPRPVFKPSYPEPDKIDLLRTVCELQDQLNRMHFPEVRRYNHFSPEREIYSDARHPHRYNLRHNQCDVSRLAFSGEAAPYGPQMSCSCLHSGQDWRYSAPLPPHNSMHRKNGPCGVHADHACCNISEASLWGYETKPENQRHDEDIIKRARLKEYFAAKRHMRPVAGGAPVVICYHCSEMLRLPADFLLFRKKYHRLMCDACKKVLRFSVRKGTHIVPYVPEASVPPPPPSEADDYNDSTGRGNTKPPPHSSSFRRVDRPVSCSDDYGDGRSFGRSCSTEGEYYNGKMSSGSSYEAIEDRKMKSISTEIENLTKGDESVGPSSKWRKANSEIEEASSSPLHRLMGYSSPSQVLDK